MLQNRSEKKVRVLMTEMISSSCNDAGDRNLRNGLRALLTCVVVILFGLLASSYQALAQPLLLEKIKEAQNQLEGLELNHQITIVQEVVPVARRSKGRGRKPAVRYVKHQGLKRDVAVVGLNLKTGELKDFTFTETVLLERKKRPSVKPPQIIAEENNCRLIWRGGSRWGFNRDLLLTCDGEEFVIINLTMWTSRTARTVVVNPKPANGHAAKALQNSFSVPTSLTLRNSIRRTLQKRGAGIWSGQYSKPFRIWTTLT